MASKDDVETGPPTMRELVKEKSVTMEYFLESSNLDAATADMLRKYDRDGNGSFSKDEVVAIILDLRETMQSNEMLGASNKFFKRMLIAVSIFSLLLLSAMFGLSYAVAALTAKLDVSSDGTMTTTDGKTRVSTDASSYTVVPVKNEDTGSFCITFAEQETLLQQATSGKSNVLVEFDGVNGTQNLIEQVSGGAITTDGLKTCFTNSQGKEICMEPSEECAPSRRRLDACTDSYTELGAAAFTTSVYIAADANPNQVTCINNNCGSATNWDSNFHLTPAGAVCACGCAGQNVRISP